MSGKSTHRTLIDWLFVVGLWIYPTIYCNINIKMKTIEEKTLMVRIMNDGTPVEITGRKNGTFFEVDTICGEINIRGIIVEDSIIVDKIYDNGQICSVNKEIIVTRDDIVSNEIIYDIQSPIGIIIKVKGNIIIEKGQMKCFLVTNQEQIEFLKYKK